VWLRAIRASGDADACLACRINQEHHRNHLSHYQNSLTLAG